MSQGKPNKQRLYRVVDLCLQRCHLTGISQAMTLPEAMAHAAQLRRKLTIISCLRPPILILDDSPRLQLYSREIDALLASFQSASLACVPMQLDFPRLDSPADYYRQN